MFSTFIMNFYFFNFYNTLTLLTLFDQYASTEPLENLRFSSTIILYRLFLIFSFLLKKIDKISCQNIFFMIYYISILNLKALLYATIKSKFKFIKLLDVIFDPLKYNFRLRSILFQLWWLPIIWQSIAIAFD